MTENATTATRVATTTARIGTEERLIRSVSLQSHEDAQILHFLIGHVAVSAAVNDCGGTGAAKGSKPETCGACNGRCKVRSQQGFFIVEKTCGQCHGTGQIIKDKCKSCNGQGRVNKNKDIEVKMPAGVEDGSKIRLQGQGESGLRGGANGDLYIFVSIREHKFFRRQGNAIYCKVPIKFTVAALGGKIDIPTISGKKMQLKIPAGTQNSAKFRIKNEGMPTINSSLKGDMFVQTEIEIPVKLTAKEKKLLQELDAELEENPNATPETNSFFDRLKDIFS